MRVALDAQLALGTATGIGEYVRGLAAALRALGVEVAELSDPRSDPWRFDRRVRWDQLTLPRLAKRSGATLLHCASGTMPLCAPLPVVVTVHDLAWLRVQAHAPWYSRSYFGAFSLARYASARRIAVDSEFTRRELSAMRPSLERRVAVVPPGVDARFQRIPRAPSRDPTLLAIGTVEPRKNLATVIRALSELPEVRLISAGPATPYLERCRALARELGVERRVEFRGYVDALELERLLASAWIAVVASRYEGFGYAAAQARCAGVPLLAANASSLPEVVADPAQLVPPGDARAWSRAVAELLADYPRVSARAGRERDAAANQFAWQRSASLMREVYASVDG